PAPRFVDASTGAARILPASAAPSEVRLESQDGTLLLSIQANDGVTNTLTDAPTLAGHATARVLITAGSNGLALPTTDLHFVDEDCETHAILLPALTLAPGEQHCCWISTVGATYLGDPSEGAANLDILERGLEPPWKTRQPGFEVDVFAGGFQLPVALAFVPNAGPDADDPFLYVAELYGRIAVVSRDGTVGTYASGLLDFNPTGAFPGSGEQGVGGLAVDPTTGDVFATMLYASPGNPTVHCPKIDRFSSVDGGRTAAVRTTILDLANEPQAQSHQISNLTLTPDGKLLCHMGDGFATLAAQNLDSFRGKILRLELDGSACADNPFYDANDGISARDYVYASGLRNPFGGEWRAADGHAYVVENGPTVDRFARLVAGRNYLWDGSDASMANFALYNWNPPHAPVGLAFVQAETFGGSGFPASSLGHAFVAESGSTYAKGLQNTGKRVTEWTLDANGELVAGPSIFLEYAGSGRATACGLEAGPDGLYVTELYADQGANAIEPGARILRVRYVAPPDCNGNDIDDTCDLASGTSSDVNANGIPDECDCAGTTYCTAKVNSKGCTPTIAATGALTVGAPDDFVVRATNVLNKKNGLLMRSSAAANLTFGGGKLCVQPPIHRFPPTNSGGSTTGLDCSGVFAQTVSDAYLASNGIVAGTTAYFQFWSRDPGFSVPNNIGLTDALKVLVCP
ncbi:MAG: PQQ-dependent sugar dehydrogenase, partial [Planctomycetes bacterium]|nr:PQQ-dependent sugar dehydrogenase [Planctomycetota bacterium]